MPSALGFAAFVMPGNSELLVLLVIGLLLFGRRLPEVGRTVGRAVGELRRNFTDFRRELEKDTDFRDAQSTVRDLKRSLEVPRIATDPKRLFHELTDESRATPAPDAHVAERAAQSPFEREAPAHDPPAR